MSTSPRPTPEDLLEYLLGSGSPALRQSIEAYTAASRENAARLDRFRAVLAKIDDAGRLEASFSVSAEQRASLKRIASQDVQSPESSPLIDAVRTIVARLTWDSRSAATPMPGFRSGATHRIQRFEFEGGCIDIRVMPDPKAFGRYWVQGDATGLTDGFATAEDENTGLKLGSGRIGQDGYFELQAGAGSLTLRLQDQSRAIVIQGVFVGDT